MERYVIAGLILVVIGIGILNMNNTPPTADFAYSPETGSAPLNVSFDGSSSYDKDGEIVGYEWEFGDGDIGSGATVTHTYNSAGSYSTKLTVTDNDGETSDTTQVITVTGPEQEPSEAPVESQSEVSQEPQESQTQELLVVLDWELLTVDKVAVVGHAKNTSSEKLDFAEIKAKFYDSNSNLVDSWFDDTTDLPAGDTWEFSIPLLNTDEANRVDHAVVSVGMYW